mgnify:CR=1 FL=1
MLRVIGVIIFALILLGLAGHLYYSRKGENQTSQLPHFQDWHIARIESATTPTS